MSDIKSLQEMIRILPYAKRTGGTLDLRDLSQEDLSDLDNRAYEVQTNATMGIRAIGEMMFWASVGDETSPNDFAKGAGLAIQTLADAIDAAVEVQTMVDYVKSGSLKRKEGGV